MNTQTPKCPRCLGPIPDAQNPGRYPGALSRTDNETEVCSDCGTAEGLLVFAGTLTPQSEWPVDSPFGGIVIEGDSGKFQE
jgi:hypothetical protein